MLKKFTILGERCSGTNYLEGLITQNFNATITYKTGWKHFFGFNDFTSSNDDTLFIAIVRNPVEWLNSLYKDPHHLAHHLRPKKIPEHLKNNIIAQRILHNSNAYHFINDKCWSVEGDSSKKNNKKEMLKDRNIYTNQRYANIFELRHTKLRYLIQDMPKKVKHYILIKYEDLINNFDATMNRIKKEGKLEVSPDISFPKNIYT